MIYLEIAIGIAAAAAVVILFRRFGGNRQLELFSVSLIIATLIYVVFAAVGLATGSGGSGWVLAESLGVAIFAVPALGGFKRIAWAPAFGWLLHTFWDLALHGGPGTSFVPGFYPAFCGGFDLAFAGYIAYYFYFRKGA